MSLSFLSAVRRFPLFLPSAKLAAAALMLAGLATPAAAQEGTVLILGVTAQMEAADIRIKEGQYAIFDIALSRSFDFDIRYAYRTQDFTAKAGKDYQAKQGHVVFPAGRRLAEVRVKTLKDNVADNDGFKLVLSDMQTHGYGMVWGSYVWTGRWRVSGLPETKTVRAWIENVHNLQLR